MNYVERLVDRKLRRIAWKKMNHSKKNHSKMQKNIISQYRWIIKNSEGKIIYDTEKAGYDGLIDFPVVIEALEKINHVEKNNLKQKKGTVKRKIIFTIDSQLHSIFPYEKLESICIS